MPRPALPKETKRSVPVFTLLRPAEVEQLDASAKRNCKTRSTELRNRLLVSFKKGRRP